MQAGRRAKPDQVPPNRSAFISPACAAMYVGGPAAILEDGRIGLLALPKDAHQPAVLIRLVESPTLRQQTGAAATVRQKWLWPQIVKQMVAVYHQ